MRIKPRRIDIGSGYVTEYVDAYQSKLFDPTNRWITVKHLLHQGPATITYDLAGKIVWSDGTVLQTHDKLVVKELLLKYCKQVGCSAKVLLDGE
jgi:hypothetical protein